MVKSIGMSIHAITVGIARRGSEGQPRRSEGQPCGRGNPAGGGGTPRFMDLSTKIAVRLLPPSLKEDDFVATLPEDCRAFPRVSARHLGRESLHNTGSRGSRQS